MGGFAVCALRTTIQMAARTLLRPLHGLNVVGQESQPTGGIVHHGVQPFEPPRRALPPLRSPTEARAQRLPGCRGRVYFFSSAPLALFSVVVVNGLPFDREQHGVAGLELCRQVLAGPGNVLIHVSGGHANPLRRPRTVPVWCGSAGRGDQHACRPVSPFRSFESWPKGQLVPHPGRLRLHIGRPRVFPDQAQGNPATAHWIAGRLRDDVAALSAANMR